MLCKECSKEFKPSAKFRKVCSSICQIENNKSRRKKYNKEYQKTNKYKEGKKKWRESPEGKEWLEKYRLDYYNKNKDRIIQTVKNYSQTKKGKEVGKQSSKKYEKSEGAKKTRLKYQHSEEAKKQKKSYYRSESGKIARTKAWKKYSASSHGKKIRKKYNQSEERKKDRRLWEKNRFDSIPEYRLIKSVRARLRKFLKSKNITKRNETFKMVGCTPKFLKEHLEKQFKPGMNWQNHTNKGWHVDHIVPLSSVKKIDEIERLMHYTNLQPLWAEDNLKKSNKI